MGSDRKDRSNLLICVLLAAATIAVYAQVYDFDYCYYDDNIYIVDNPAIKYGLRPGTIKWACTTNYMCNWHPLTWMSHLLDTDIANVGSWIIDGDLGRDHSGFFHLTSVALHTINAVLLFLVLFEYTGYRWRSAFAAALFALHPLHVESVAWIAERKDVLSTLFWILTMRAYLRWLRGPNARSYAALVVLFALGLAAKPMLVSLPIVLLLLDVWPLGRYTPMAMEAGARSALARLVREKWPLFVLAAASCVVTFWAQKTGGAVQTIQDFPIWVRVLNAFNSGVGYLWKMIWPAKLAALYPHPGTGIAVLPALAAGALLAAMTVLAAAMRKSRPYLLVGWLWYLVTLVPVIGLVQVGSQAMADRYTYVPLIGIFTAIAWAAPDLLAGMKSGRARTLLLGAAAASILVALACVTYRQIGFWRNPEALYGRAIAVTSNNAAAHMSYGCIMINRGELDTAIKHLRIALDIDPNYLDARYNYADALFNKGDYDAAERELKLLTKQWPHHPYAHAKLADIYMNRFEWKTAIRHLKLALRDRESFTAFRHEAVVRNNLGLCYVRLGRMSDAAAEFRRAVEADPTYTTAYENLQRALEE